jgi:hypothetical protein
MDISAGPVALGGVLMCVALAAWALGRWQSGISPSFDAAVKQDAEAAAMPGEDVQDDAAIPRPLAAQARRHAMHTEASLGEVHAEITAYRRAERVLNSLGGDALDYSLRPPAGDGDSRDGYSDPVLVADVMAQPSPPASGFTRV